MREKGEKSRINDVKEEISAWKRRRRRREAIALKPLISRGQTP